MRYLPMLQEAQKHTLQTTTFLGYNHNEIISDGEMYDMLNLSGERYPLLSRRRARGITRFDQGGIDDPLTAIHGRDQLVMCLGTRVYYNFVPVSGVTVSAEPEMLPKKIVSMGAYVCIWPDKVYFNTAMLSDCGSMDRTWSASGSGISLTMCRGDGTNYDMTQITVGPTAPANPAQGALWIDQSGENDVLRQWSSYEESWVEVATVYVKISGTGIGQGLKEYDVINLSGLTAQDSKSARVKSQVSALNGSAIVYGAGSGYIMIAGLISQTQSALKSVTVRADRTVPDLDYVCESNNRLWGCKYGIENGVAVNEIRASKLGDFKNWQCFMGLSTDSYTASVGTDGFFTGAVTQKGYPVFFKENCIHRVSGSTPSTFAITTTVCRGIQNGSWRSAVVVNEAIYYKARTGVMVYDGSMPRSVSEALGGVLYRDARAGALAGKYYISMQDQAGEWQMFVYDTEKQLWHREDHLRATCFGRVDDELYCIDEENNRLVAIRGSMGEIEEDFPWEAVFGLYGTDIKNEKYLSRFNIRMYIEPGSRVQMQIMYDQDGEWLDEGEIVGRGTKAFVLPVIPRRCDHLRFRMRGNGDFRIYSIARQMEVGSDG